MSGWNVRVKREEGTFALVALKFFRYHFAIVEIPPKARMVLPAGFLLSTNPVDKQADSGLVTLLSQLFPH